MRAWVVVHRRHTRCRCAAARAGCTWLVRRPTRAAIAWRHQWVQRRGTSTMGGVERRCVPSHAVLTHIHPLFAIRRYPSSAKAPFARTLASRVAAAFLIVVTRAAFPQGIKPFARPRPIPTTATSAATVRHLTRCTAATNRLREPLSAPALHARVLSPRREKPDIHRARQYRRCARVRRPASHPGLLQLLVDLPCSHLPVSHSRIVYLY